VDVASASQHASTAPQPFGRPSQVDAHSQSETSAWTRVVVGLSIVVWFALVSLLAYVRYQQYLGGRFDLGNMVQAVRNTAHGHPLEVTLVTSEQTVRLAAHADIFLAALAPLWLVFPTPMTLLVVQIAALALGALPVYWLARRHIGSDKAAVLMAWAYLFYPWLAWGGMNDFHSVAVGSSFLLFAIWALDSNRLVLFSVFAVAALTTHELVGLLIAGLGAWYAIARGHRRAGGLICLGGFLWTVFCLEVLIPHYAAGGHSQFYGRFASTGGSPGGIVKTLVQDPLVILRAVTSADDVVYLFLLVLPLVGLLFLAPGIALAASPLLAMNLLSDWWATTNPLYQYTTPLIPFLIAATVFGVARFSPGRVRGAATVAGVAAVAFVVLGPTLAVLNYDFSPERADALDEAVALVPDSAKVSSTERLGGPLSARRVIYSFPMIRDADWIVVDRRDVWIPDLPTVRRGLMPKAMARAFQRLDNDRRFHRVYKRGTVEIYRRSA
jgi:uncharacterized membrane protein